MSLMAFDKRPPEEQNLKTIVGLAVGRASVCWEGTGGLGVFQSEDASCIVDEVIYWIEQRYEPKDKAPVNPRPNGYQDQSPILRYFVFNHLPQHLQDVSRPFSDLAWGLEADLPVGPEKSVALRKLLEAKDAAVRAALDR